MTLTYLNSYITISLNWMSTRRDSLIFKKLRNYKGGAMTKHKCMYCLQTKDDAEFNREHVVPEMMGKYQNGYVLSSFQVCKDCNTYFSNQVENRIALDSYEALLRMQFRDTPMSDGRKLLGKRIRLLGDEGVLKGIPFKVVTDKNSPYRIRFEAEEVVGIINCSETQEYTYYTLEDLPEATEEVRSKIKDSALPIINTGIDRETLENCLTKKGYLGGQHTYSDKSVVDIYKDPEFTTVINMKIDSYVRRLCAKTVFNYLCYSKGKDFVLDCRFDAIREYIRFGNWSDGLWFRYSKGPVSTVKMPNDTAHVVGYMWYLENGQWILCGCLTWFGDLTYIFKLGESNLSLQKINVLDSTKMACFDNVNRTITEDDAVHVYAGRQDVLSS